MAVEIFCPKCHTNYFVSAAKMGKKVRCARCKSKFIAADLSSMTEPLSSMITLSEETLVDGSSRLCNHCHKANLTDAVRCKHCGKKL